MTKWLVSIALLASGCGSDCDKLKKKMCEGQDDATCTAMKKWFDDDFLKGPNGEKMSSDEAGPGCKLIMDDKEAMTNFLESARAKAKK